MNIKNYLFFDIETHRVKEFSEISPKLQDAFRNHYFDGDSYDSIEAAYAEQAALHPEFSHVICISFGYEANDGFHKTSICTTDEPKLLKSAKAVFDAYCSQGYILAGHNIKGCDIPYMAKRYIINDMKIPDALNNYGKKPWEVDSLDTMDLWKLGSWRGSALETICAALGISCKSEEVSGANLYEYPIAEVPMDELQKYCEEDVESNYLMTKVIFKYL